MCANAFVCQRREGFLRFLWAEDVKVAKFTDECWLVMVTAV
jgi:hypothetical protein